VRSLWLGILLLWATLAGAARDLTVGWDNPNTTVGDVDWYELQWRNPTDWNQVTIVNRVVQGAELETSRRYLMRNVVAGTLEVWGRACRDKVAGEESACTSPMVDGWTSGCCSAWGTLTVNEPSQPTKPIISP
jgi:hypothetical protein